MATTLLVAVLVSLVLTPVVRALLVRLDIVDVPNARSSHARVTPRGGGLAVIAATMTAVAVAPQELDATLVGVCGAALLHLRMDCAPIVMAMGELPFTE